MMAFGISRVFQRCRGHSWILEGNGQLHISRLVNSDSCRKFFSYRYWDHQQDVVVLHEIFEKSDPDFQISVLKKAKRVALHLWDLPVRSPSRYLLAHLPEYRSQFESLESLETLLLLVGDRGVWTEGEVQLVDVDMEGCHEFFKMISSFFSEHPLKGVGIHIAEAIKA